jgi:hypothetical protein
MNSSTSPTKPPGTPKALTGSADAKRKAAIILEALTGVRTIQSACMELEIAVPRYYVLEARVLQAMIDALEPRAGRRKRSFEAELKQHVETNQRLEREVMRLQALYRATQRAVGVKDPDKRKSDDKTVRTRRPRTESRGKRISKTLRASKEDLATDVDTLTSGSQGGQ